MIRVSANGFSILTTDRDHARDWAVFIIARGGCPVIEFVPD